MSHTETLTWTRNGTTFEVEVEYSASGEYHPATWEQPEEFPEVEVHEVRPVNMLTGQVRAKPLKLATAELVKLDQKLWAKLWAELCSARRRRSNYAD